MTKEHGEERIANLERFFKERGLFPQHPHGFLRVPKTGVGKRRQLVYFT